MIKKYNTNFCWIFFQRAGARLVVRIKNSLISTSFGIQESRRPAFFNGQCLKSWTVWRKGFEASKRSSLAAKLLRRSQLILIFGVDRLERPIFLRPASRFRDCQSKFETPSGGTRSGDAQFEWFVTSVSSHQESKNSVLLRHCSSAE